MTLTLVYPDAAKAFRNYLRDHATDLGVAVDRINLGTAPGPAAQITVQRVGGGDDNSTAPLDRPLLQIDCWHDTSANTATNVRNAVRSLLNPFRPGQLDSATYGYGATVVNEIFLHDGETNASRFSLTVSAVIRAIT